MYVMRFIVALVCLLSVQAEGDSNDDNPASYWQTAATPHPHHISIDIAAAGWIRGFTYLPREDGGEGSQVTSAAEISVIPAERD